MEPIDLSKEGFKVEYEREGNKYYASVNTEFSLQEKKLLPTNKMIVVLQHSTGTHIFKLEEGDNDNWISKDAPKFIEEDIIYEIGERICDKYM